LPFLQGLGLNQREDIEGKVGTPTLPNESLKKPQLQNKRGEFRTAGFTNKNMGGQEI
jgi:hypothetical protein